MRDNILIRVDEHRDIDDGALIEKTYSVVLYRNPGKGEKPLAYLYSSDNPDMARGVREYLITRMPLDNLMDIIDDLPTRLPGEAVKGCNKKVKNTNYDAMDEENLKAELVYLEKSLKDRYSEMMAAVISKGKYKSAYLDQAKRTINLVTAIQKVVDIWDNRLCSSTGVNGLTDAVNELKKEVKT